MLFGFAQSNGGVDRVQAHEAGRGKDEEAHLEKHFFGGGSLRSDLQLLTN